MERKAAFESMADTQLGFLAPQEFGKAAFSHDCCSVSALLVDG